MMRRFVDRIRSECAALVRQEFDGVQHSLEKSWSVAVDELRHDLHTDRDSVESRELADRAERAALASAIQRLAEALDTMSAAVEAERRERVVQIDLVELLLREVILSWPEPAPIAAARGTRIVGGSIDAQLLEGATPNGLDPAPDVDLRALEMESEDESVDSDAELTVGTAVEVRSHFHDRWSHGFRITEVVYEGGRRHFKLSRRSDGSSLPILFDATDVRRTSTHTEGPFAADFVQHH